MSISMLLIRALYIFIMLGLVSCNIRNNTTINPSLLIGDWKICIIQKTKYTKGKLEIPPPPSFLFLKAGYTFYSDYTCDKRVGYFVPTHYSKSESYIQFLGNKTKYRLQNDTLSILDLSNNTWKSKKIYSISADSLILQINDSTFEKYKKMHYPTNNENLYDIVIIESSGCFGFCPSNNIIIDRHGKAIFQGRAHNSKNGNFSACITDSQFQSIENNFKKASIEKLDDHYDAPWTCDEEITVTFIKDGKIIRTISDYGGKAPAEFYWAYQHARYLYQQLKLDTLVVNPIDYGLGFLRFELDKKFYRLSFAECYSLSSMLSEKKEKEITFVPKYKTKYLGGKYYKKIETNGRFFKFNMQNGTNKTYDLGFDFFERNNLNDKFTIKDK